MLRARPIASFLRVLGFLVLSHFAHAQQGQWTWMRGQAVIGTPGCPDTCYGTAVYGTLAVPAPGNTPGGRQGAVTWVDKSGNLWLFGGEGVDSTSTVGYLNDLWEFNPSTNQWTWVGGSNTIGTTTVGGGQPGVYSERGTDAPSNIPGGRANAVGWSDSSGNLWLFGGWGYDMFDAEGGLNDLWEYKPSTGQWAWFTGTNFLTEATNPSPGVFGWPGVYGTLGQPAASNTPGGRYSATAWTDETGRFWLFGGSGSGNETQLGWGQLNDLWMFDPSTGEWAWMGGSQSLQPLGVYGLLGAPAATNTPGGRVGPMSWIDKRGNPWIFGGAGPDVNGVQTELNDLWQFDTSVAEWTWMGGPDVAGSTAGIPGVYGTLGVPAPANYPGVRQNAMSWTDTNGNFWLFGGQGWDSANNYGELNDLWEMNPLSNQWAWESGPSTMILEPRQISGFYGDLGVYGTLGVPDSSNIPGSRYGALTWATPDGNQWLFGGEGYDSVGARGYLNDLWEYQPAATITWPTATPAFSVAAGTYSAAQSVSIFDDTPNATIYYTTNGSTPTVNSTAYSGPIQIAATEQLQAIAVASGYSSSTIASVNYTISLPPSFTLAAAPATLTLKPGSQGAIILTVTPQNGFKSTISFSCSGMPTSGSCTFSPATLTPSGNAITTALTIIAPTQPTAATKGRARVPQVMVATLSLCLVLFLRGGAPHRWLSLLPLVAVTSICFGCGGGTSSSTTLPSNPPPVVVGLSVLANASSQSQTVTISLTVD